MAEKKNYEARIKKAIKKAGGYSQGLNFQVQALASAMHSLDLANEEIAGLTVTTVLEKTRYGSKLAPHPAFKVQRDAMDAITRQLKALNLTADALSVEAESDPLVEITEKIHKAGEKASTKAKQKVTRKPKAKGEDKSE